MRGEVKIFADRRAQVWVETVIYLLIAFVMIGLVLSFVKPKIEQIRDKAIIEQSIEVLNNVDQVFSEIEKTPGNKRIVEIGIKKGEFIIDSANDLLEFYIQSSYVYSEPGENVTIGKINITTVSKGKYNDVTLKVDYSGQYNMTYKGKDESKTLSKASVPYQLIISNTGEDSNQKTVINFDLG